MFPYLLILSLTDNMGFCNIKDDNPFRTGNEVPSDVAWLLGLLVRNWPKLPHREGAKRSVTV